MSYAQDCVYSAFREQYWKNTPWFQPSQQESNQKQNLFYNQSAPQKGQLSSSNKAQIKPLNLSILPKDGGPPTEVQERRQKYEMFENSCSKLTPYLYVGGEIIAKNYEVLKQNGITHVINSIASTCQNQFPDKFAYLSLYLEDMSAEDIMSVFYESIEFIQDAIQQDGVVFIHCHQGVSRSASIAMAYLMWKTNLSYDKVFSLVKAIRLIVNPNLGFACQLKLYEKRLQGNFDINIYRVSLHTIKNQDLYVPKILDISNPSNLTFEQSGIYVISVHEIIYVWIGSKSQNIQISYVSRVANQIRKFELQGSLRDMVLVHQGQEPEDLIQIFSDVKNSLYKSSRGPNSKSWGQSKKAYSAQFSELLGNSKVYQGTVDLKLFRSGQQTSRQNTPSPVEPQPTSRDSFVSKGTQRHSQQQPLPQPRSTSSLQQHQELNKSSWFHNLNMSPAKKKVIEQQFKEAQDQSTFQLYKQYFNQDSQNNSFSNNTSQQQGGIQGSRTQRGPKSSTGLGLSMSSSGKNQVQQQGKKVPKLNVDTKLPKNQSIMSLSLQSPNSTQHSTDQDDEHSIQHANRSPMGSKTSANILDSFNSQNNSSMSNTPLPPSFGGGTPKYPSTFNGKDPQQVIPENNTPQNNPIKKVPKLNIGEVNKTNNSRTSRLKLNIPRLSFRGPQSSREPATSSSRQKSSGGKKDSGKVAKDPPSVRSHNGESGVLRPQSFSMRRDYADQSQSQSQQNEGSKGDKQGGQANRSKKNMFSPRQARKYKEGSAFIEEGTREDQMPPGCFVDMNIMRRNRNKKEQSRRG